MSTLWTPGGERPVDPAPDDGKPVVDGDDLSLDDLSPEEREKAEEIVREMAAVQEEVANTAPEVYVNNHLMGLFNLAVIHLSHQPPNLEAAALAIDALGAVVDRLSGRLGDDEGTIKEYLKEVRMAYVGLQREMAAQGDAEVPGDDAGGDVD
jgi:hypothetical protein